MFQYYFSASTVIELLPASKAVACTCDTGLAGLLQIYNWGIQKASHDSNTDYTF